MDPAIAQRSAQTPAQRPAAIAPAVDEGARGNGRLNFAALGKFQVTVTMTAV
jgi:hypothetical protein